jgi:hypothetical protein
VTANSSDRLNARAVIDALQSFANRIEQILSLIGDKKFISPGEKEYVQELYRSLKSDMKDAAKYRTTDRVARALTNFENTYFESAVRQAAANMTVAVNSHPLRSNWYGCLYGVKIDVEHPLWNLRKQFPDVD